MADLPIAGQESWDRIAHRAVEGPLARIIAGLEAVAGDAKSQLTPALKQAVHGSLATAHRLQDMFESLLAVERINTGTATIGDVPVSVGVALEPAVRGLEARAKASEVSFGWSAKEVALAVAGDEDLLRRAVRLAGERVMDDVPKGGSVRIAAATDGRAVRVRITGSAPPPDSAFSVTEPVEIGFARLAVERMGGKVTCVRTPDSGSMIDLLLPAPGAQPAPPAAASVPAPAPPAPGSVTADPVVPVFPPVEVPVVASPSLAIQPASPPSFSPGAVQSPATPAPPPGAAGSTVRFDAAPTPPPDRPVPEPGEEKHDPSAAPKLSGMTITAAWTGTGKKPDAAAGHHLAVSSALPPGTEKMKDEPAGEVPEPPAKAGGLKITRHVDFDLMSQE